MAKKSTTPHRLAAPEGFLTVRQAAERLNVSHPTIQKMILCGRLPAINLGLGKTHASYRIAEEDVDKLFQRIETK